MSLCIPLAICTSTRIILTGAGTAHPRTAPTTGDALNPAVTNIRDFVFEDFTLEDPHPHIKAPVAIVSAFKAIAAMSLNRVIGRGLEIPHLPEDFKWFKQTTMGQVMVMGRRTFDSIGRVAGRKPWC